MPQVSAGSKTGIYYIIVAGLPWKCTWQRLKDFARNVQPDGSFIDIDHAMVYPESPTNGWVRVKGKENFKKALAHLDGGVLDGKAIIADGRNEGEDTPLPDLPSTSSWSASLPRRHRGSSPASSSRQSSSSHSDYQDYYQDYYQSSQSSQSSQPTTTYGTSEASADWYYQPTTSSYSPMCPTYTTVPYNTHASPSPSVYATQYSVPTSGVMYAGQIAPTAPVYVQAPLSYMVPLPYAEAPTSSTSIADSTHYATPTSPVIRTEARKIIITQLSQSISTTDLHELLITAIQKSSKSYSQYPVEEAEIACHSNGSPRGHAFVTLESHHLAKAVIKALDGTKYQKRTIQARFIKECAEPAKIYSPPQDNYLMSPPPAPAGSSSKEHRKEKKSTKEKEASKKQGKGKSRRDDEGERSRHRGKEVERERRVTPLVVDGSLRDHRK